MRVCVLGSSSEGNATALWTGKTSVLIDAGFSAKELGKRLKDIGLDPSKLEGIVLSHEHSDHIRGAGVLSRKYAIPVFANRTTFELSGSLKNVSLKRYFHSNKDFEIGDRVNISIYKSEITGKTEYKYATVSLVGVAGE